ncbi:MAG: hypothetical protein AAF389_21345 [Gemmatimonadota bacterium]
MSAARNYALAGAGFVAAIIAVSWPFLGDADRFGLLRAAAIALPVQAFAFASLVRNRGAGNGFFAAWVGGTFLRMLVLAAVAAVIIQSGTEGGVATLLALAGFFFGLLLLEPVYFRPEPTPTADA